ncbi:MAG: peptidylprolyl isomerase [Bacteroidales bacterium]|jgi:hypothetical protein|nr:peptidylprolyl isomerase [Bacteroidales bacterium]
MIRIAILTLLILVAGGCADRGNQVKRIPLARAGESILYLDEIPPAVMSSGLPADSSAMVQEFINKWASRVLMYQKARENLSPELREDIERQISETRADLTIYQYQRQMMLEKMDTTITDAEMETYYNENTQSFSLGYNIIKALFIKLPFDTPNLWKIKSLARSGEQKDLQELESICYQFADKFDDFNEQWVPLDRVSVELPQEISNPESFLRRTSFYEYTDSVDVYLLKIRDYRMRSTPAPFDYVKDDIKRIIWNNRRLEFIQNLETGIYRNAIEENRFSIINKR